MWFPSIFAAKTTASALIALLIAFTFNLDQPKWVLITVFIVAQPQSGLVLAKSFYRVFGTLIGAAVALFLVALFAQERVLFLGALALWIGFCTFASRYAQNFTAYGFVLSGYTSAIVGIPGALDPANAFYVATARVTEVGLGIAVTATVSHLVLPASLTAALGRAIAEARNGLADYAATLLKGSDAALLRKRLIGEALAIKSLYASAIFESREIRDRSGAVQRLEAAFADVVNLGELLAWQLDGLRASERSDDSKINEAVGEAILAIADWRNTDIDASKLGERLVRARSTLPHSEELCRDASRSDTEVVRGFAVVARLRAFLAAFATYAHATEAFNSDKARSWRVVDSAASKDPVGALWAGLRAALALALVAIFWILADWPSGPTAVILAAVVTARLAIMENAGKAAIAGTFVVAFAALPAFIIIEVLLPHAQGFEMFTLLLAPVLFLCAFLMANNKAPLAYLTGFLCALYFASVGAFADRTAYDAIAFVNTSIAVILAIAVGAVLFAIVAPEAPEAARREIARTVRQSLAKILDPSRRPGLGEFQAEITEALGRFKQQGAEDNAAREAGIALLGAGRALMRLRGNRWCGQRGLNIDPAAVASPHDLEDIDRIRTRVQVSAAEALADLRDGTLGAAAAQAAAQKIVLLSAIGDALERGSALLIGRS